MQTILAKPDIPTVAQIRCTIGAALDGWRYSPFSWGGEWDYVDDYGDRYAVALVDRLTEIEVYKPREDLAAVITFGSRTDGTHSATLDTLTTVLMEDLEMPEYGQ